MTNRKNWQTSTRLNHPQEIELRPGNRPVISPVYHSAKFALSDNDPYFEQFLYTRIANPTTRQLEQTLAEVQQREDCLVLASGAAALTGTFLSLLKQGDHIITFRELYKPARTFIREMLPNFGIEHTLLSLGSLDQLEAAITPGKTKLIHFESPSNPNLVLADIDFILAVAKKHNVLVSMDGTFAGLHQHVEYPVDLMIHSLTKFGNGHGDVIAGSVAGRSDLIQQIRSMAIYLGATLDPQACYMVGRGLKTYMLRYERQCQTATMVAQFLSHHPGVAKTYYPALPTHPGHELALKQMQLMGGVIAFEIKCSVATGAEEFCHRTSLIQVTASLGSTESLMCPTLPFFGTDLSELDRSEMGINHLSVRLSVGLEDPQDIIADLKEALSSG